MSALAGVLWVGGLGVVFTTVTGSKMLKARRLQGSGVTTQGVVVAQHSSPSAGATGNTYLQHPEVEFTTADGRLIRVTSPAGLSEAAVLPGQSVTVHYDPRDPRRASIPGQETVVYRILLAVGLFMLAVPVAYLLFGDRLQAALLGIPALLGAVFTAIGCFGVRHTWRLKHGGRTGGVVVGSVESGSRYGTQHHPVVRYTTETGWTVDAPSVRGHLGRPLAPGTPVAVCYDRADPRRMVLAHQSAPATFWVFGVIGVLVLLVGLAVLAAVAL